MIGQPAEGSHDTRDGDRFGGRDPGTRSPVRPPPVGDAIRGPCAADGCRAGLHALGRRRQGIPRLLVAARQRQPRLRRPARDRGHRRTGAPARVRLAAVLERAPGPPRGADRRDHARRPRQDLLHGRRQRGQRGCGPARAPLHRPNQDHHELPRLPRRHDGHAQPQRNGREQRVRTGHPRCRPRAVAGLLPVPVRSGLSRLPDRVRGAVRGAHPAGEPGDGRGGDARARPGRRRRPDPAAGVPPEDPRDLRQVWGAADPRRGRDRLRPDRALVRLGALGRRARHHDDGQGAELGVRRARRDDRPPAARRLLRRRTSSTSATRTAASRWRSRSDRPSSTRTGRTA